MSGIGALLGRLTDLRSMWDAISAVDIEQFEKSIGTALPQDYREFLLVQNGGFLGYHDSFDGWWIQWLYGLGSGATQGDLRDQRSAFNVKVEEGFLVIGDAGEFSTTCLCLRPDHFGEVWKWDRCEEISQPWEYNAGYLCDSFEELLRGLEPNEPKIDYLAYEARGKDEPFRSVITFDEASLRSYLKAGGDVNCRDAERQTPLFEASMRWPFAARMLVEYGADVQARDRDGQTPLHYSVAAECFDGSKLLLEHGANPRAKDAHGKTPLSTVNKKHNRLRNLLMQYARN